MSTHGELLVGSSIARLRPDGAGWLLRDVSCHIAPGHRIAVAGPSGAGKTLLLRALAMLDPLDRGEVLWKGQSVRGSRIPDFRRHVTFLHQRAALFEGTVEQNLRQPYSLSIHQQLQYNRKWSVHLLERLGRPSSFLEKETSVLSGGEAQIVSLLRAIQLEPSVLLLDEPTSALDVDTTRAVEDLTRNWVTERADRRALVWISHDQEQAQRIATRRLRLEDGRIVASEE